VELCPAKDYSLIKVSLTQNLLVACSASAQHSTTSSALSSSSSSLAAQVSTTLSVPATNTTSLSSSATSGLAAIECSPAHDTTYSPAIGYTFTKYCDVDWPSGEPTASGGGTVEDLNVQVMVALVGYSSHVH